MENDIKLNPQELQIQGLIARYLTSRNAPAVAEPHIDEDSLAAFVEGTLNARESDAAVSHLVDCGFCRHATAEIVRLDMEFAEDAPSVTEAAVQPARLSEVLSGIFSKIFGSTEGAVFAHEDKDEKGDEGEETKENNDETK